MGRSDLRQAGDGYGEHGSGDALCGATVSVIDMDAVAQRGRGGVVRGGVGVRVEVGWFDRRRGLRCLKEGGRGPVVDEEQDRTPGEEEEERHRREAKRGDSEAGRCGHASISSRRTCGGIRWRPQIRDAI